MAFGKKKPTGKTILLLDIESGSVGAGLARVGEGLPKLFAEKRVSVPLLSTRDSDTLIHYIEKALRESLEHTAGFAARMRGNEKLSPLGSVSSASVFLGAPWGVPDLSEGRAVYAPRVRQRVGDEISAFLGYVPVRFNTGADAAVFGSGLVLPQERMLLCVVRAEITELLLMGSGVEGYATIPVGSRSFARTLKVHADVPEQHLHSLISLSKHRHAGFEPLSAAAKYFLDEFKGAAEELLVHGGVSSVYIIGESPVGEWLAEAFEDAGMDKLFPRGGVVRSVAPHHFLSYLDIRKSAPDLYLALSALFADAALGGL